ncbi:hypothetical protein ANTRET_LOCUS7946 [Anthophora retusa]
MDQWIVDVGWLNFPYEVAVPSDIKKLSIGSRTSGRNEVRIRSATETLDVGVLRGLLESMEHLDSTRERDERKTGSAPYPDGQTYIPGGMMIQSGHTVSGGTDCIHLAAGHWIAILEQFANGMRRTGTGLANKPNGRRSFPMTA